MLKRSIITSALIIWSGTYFSLANAASQESHVNKQPVNPMLNSARACMLKLKSFQQENSPFPGRKHEQDKRQKSKDIKKLHKCANIYKTFIDSIGSSESSYTVENLYEAAMISGVYEEQSSNFLSAARIFKQVECQMLRMDPTNMELLPIILEKRKLMEDKLVNRAILRKAKGKGILLPNECNVSN